MICHYRLLVNLKNRIDALSTNRVIPTDGAIELQF